MAYELRRFDTYPPIPVLLTDSSGAPAIDLTNASSVHFEMKGLTAPLVTGVCTISQIDITATEASTTTLTSVSPTTGYANGATINGPGIPTGTTIVSGAGTATLIISNSATLSGSQSLIVSQGLVAIPLNTAPLAGGFTTADTYTGECEIHWAAGGTQTVPNAVGQNFTIIVDADEEDG